MSRALLDAWEKTLRSCGPRRAVVQAADGQSCTFRELDARATAWLAAQAPAGPALLARHAVVFAAPNGIGWLEIFLGLLRAGAVIVPLDASEPPAAQRQLAAQLRAGFWWDGDRLVPLEGARRFREPAISLIKLTSGTTGRPRPLAFTAAQLLADARQVTATMGITSRDLNYALIPLGHSYGLGNLTLPLLAQGVPLVCGAAPLPHAIAADFVRWRPTVFPGVPAVWRALAASDVTPADLASLRLAISAGAPLPPEAARDFAARFGHRVHAFYGSSETGGISYDRTGQATLAGSVGLPLRGVGVTLLRGGRLRVRSAAVFTHGNRRHDGRIGSWLPPDRAMLAARGAIMLLGRRGTTVKIGGRRVNLAEVTTRLRQLPGIHDVWVGISPGADPILGAAVATERPVPELRAELQTDTASWKIPKKWLALPTLPLTARGKTDTRVLQEKLFPS
jgi:acyl-CoA synthetase (AMP-forming)/AMP-acid ligase II